MCLTSKNIKINVTKYWVYEKNIPNLILTSKSLKSDKTPWNYLEALWIFNWIFWNCLELNFYQQNWFPCSAIFSIFSIYKQKKIALEISKDDFNLRLPRLNYFNSLPPRNSEKLWIQNQLLIEWYFVKVNLPSTSPFFALLFAADVD